jgi:hypothetical protein
MLIGERCWEVRREFVLAAMTIAALVMSVGCSQSDKIEIGGRVTRKDGSPLVGAKVTFRAPGSGRTATGVTDADGRYVLGTSKPGEGIPPEGYYVTVSEDLGTENAPISPTIHEKYTRPSDSGLKFKVQPGGETTYDIVLDPA